MPYHPRIESSTLASLSTTRSRNSELWLNNNRTLEQTILGSLAKCVNRYGVELYAFGIEGNHVHDLAHYPEANRGEFHRDLNSSIAKAVASHAPGYPGGRFWGRRYSCEFVPEAEDIEEYFFYVALQAVKDGLVDRISDYPGYNFFDDAVSGIKRKFKVVRWTEYHDARRWNDKVDIGDFTETFELSYKRLPGYEDLTQQEYRELMYEKLEARRLEILRQRNKPCLGVTRLKKQLPGSRPRTTKKSDQFSHRPRILCVCPKRRQAYKAWYFSIYFEYKEASGKFRAGKRNVKFPPGTFKPPLFTCKARAPDIPLDASSF